MYCPLAVRARVELRDHVVDLQNQEQEYIRNNVLCASFGGNGEFLYVVDHTPDLSVFRDGCQ